MMIALVAVSGCAQTGERQENAAEQIKGEKVNISSGSLSYPAYLAAPGKEGVWPGVVMIHSCNGLEPGYLSLADKLGLTGFCAGGRYTMLFLPQINQTFRSGVAWYGFPYSGGFLNQSQPAQIIDQLDDPLLIIHGTYDVPSKITDIYRYAEELNASGRYFEMKVYQGEPHGFMIEDGQLSQSFAAEDALYQMASFFDRTLKGV
jgi:carboxymethylenebutenolidase